MTGKKLARPKIQEMYALCGRSPERTKYSEIDG